MGDTKAQQNALLGTWGNSRRAVTTTYTVSLLDKGWTIACGGSAFYTVAFNAASGYDSDFQVVILNEDSGRAKNINLTGSSFMLWPGQSVIVFNQNGVWQTIGRTRWKTSGTVTLYVDPGGNDSNDGLASGTSNAVKTMFQAVANIAQKQWDVDSTSAPNVTVQLADGTHTGGLHFPGILTGGAGHAMIRIQGNASTPSNVIVQGDGAGAPPFSVFDNTILELQNMKLQDTASVAGLISVSSGAMVRLEGGIIFGQTPTGQPHIFAFQDGKFIADAGYTISDAAHTNDGYHIICQDRGFVYLQGQTVTFSASVNFATTVLGQRQSMLNLGNVTWSLGASTVTGKRFEADDLTMISVFGAGATAIPGNVAGTTSNGSVCA